MPEGHDPYNHFGRYAIRFHGALPSASKALCSCWELLPYDWCVIPMAFTTPKRNRMMQSSEDHE